MNTWPSSQQEESQGSFTSHLTSLTFYFSLIILHCEVFCGKFLWIHVQWILCKQATTKGVVCLSSFICKQLPYIMVMLITFVCTHLMHVTCKQYVKMVCPWDHLYTKDFTTSKKKRCSPFTWLFHSCGSH